MDKETGPHNENRTLNNKLFDYSQELVMLNYLFESKMLSKDEMLIIKQDIEKSYGINNCIIS